MRKFLFALCLVVFSTELSAQTMRRIWIQMPDSIVPYLTESNRTELADYVTMEMESAVRNLLKDTTRITVLLDNYVDVELSSSSRLQIKLLPWAGDRSVAVDSILCVVTTYRGPSAESKIAFYSRLWEPLRIASPVASTGFTDAIETYVQRPDSISESDYRDLISPLDMHLLVMELSPRDDSLCLHLSLPSMAREEAIRIEPLLLQRKLKWNGQRFN